MIVVCEGVDASGKQTQSKLLAEKLGGTRFTFPNYDSPTGALILSHLKKRWICAAPSGCGHRIDDELTDARVFQCLQTVNRIEMLPEIRRAMTKGPVIFDRYWASACVYGSLDGLDREWLRLVQEKPMPPATVNILIDVPIAEGFARRPDRRDRYEIDRPFLEKVRAQYLRLWDAQAQLFPASQQWHIVNGLGTIEEVHERIMKIVAEIPIG